MVSKHINMSKGFTVPEVLVVISIIAILSLIMLPYYDVAKQQLAVERSASKLAQDIRLVIEKAKLTQEEPACGSSYSYGYGIRLRTNDLGEYLLFADCDNNNNYDLSDELIGQGPIEFEDGVEIESLSRNNLNIVFRPPDPTVTISNNDDMATIIIRSVRYPEKKRTIIINKIGLIDIN